MATQALLNDFATRSFRNTADQDYIAARMSYRAGLIEQFHWQGLQALEKYLKAILLYNSIKAKRIRHSLSKALEFAKLLPFEFDFSESTHELIKHLDAFGRFRYLEVSYFISGPKLVQLDKAIWEVRRYCRVLNHALERPDGSKKGMLPLELERIMQSRNRPPHKFRILGGALEKILDNKDHPARQPLIWQNAFFGSISRKNVKMVVHFQAKNAPLTLHPEILEEVNKYVDLPNEAVKAYSNRS